MSKHEIEVRIDRLSHRPFVVQERFGTGIVKIHQTASRDEARHVARSWASTYGAAGPFDRTHSGIDMFDEIR